MTNKINKELVGATPTLDAIEGAKRQYAPYEIIWECPICGEDNKIDYTGNRYLCNPVWGEDYEDSLDCSNCDYHGTVILRPYIKIEIIDAYDDEDDAA
jgi:hypothetical protein